jgi:hypothetical protein
MVASALSPSPLTETTVPRPKVSWETRSPASSFIVLLTFPVALGGANERLIEDLIGEIFSCTWFHSITESGISLKNLDAAL